MNERIISRILLIAGACGLVVLWLLHGSKTDFAPDAPPRPVSPPVISAAAEQELLVRSLALESERHHIDQTIWAKELLAERHEEVFIGLWDQLRNSSNATGVLSEFAFGELLLGQPSGSTNLDLEISRIECQGTGSRLNATGWKSRLESWTLQGYQLAQSEWRHPSFSANEDGTIRSVIAMTLHVTNSTTKERVIIRGDLGVRWKENPDAQGAPFPEEIDARSLEILSRTGPVPFEEVLVKEIPTALHPVFIDPLIVYDLNRDGLDEILIPGQNLAYKNLGQGRFQTGRLCSDFIPSINVAIVADFNGDGAADLVGADRDGLIFWAGDRTVRFSGVARRVRFTAAELPNPFVLTAGDVDGDGDLDLWVAQYKLPYVAGQMPTPYYDANDGFPSFLLLNDGNGEFRDATAEAGLAEKRFRRTYSASFIDLDADGDLDLLVVSDFAGVDLYYNDGQGHFVDVTGHAVDEPHAFGMAHTFGDYNLDGSLDFLVVGMNSYAAQRLDQLGLGPDGFPEHQRMRSKMAYGNRLYLGGSARWEQRPLSQAVARSGWSWGATSFDFDNDGDLDLYIVNGHKSRASAKDYENQFWRHDIYMANSTHDPALDTYFRAVASRLYGAGQSYGGYEKNRLFLNQAGASFLESAFLAGLAMEQDCRNVVSDDLDGDGQLDLVVTTLQVWPQDLQTLHLFQNRLGSRGNWIGFELRENGAGCSPVGATITLTAGGVKQTRHLVTGDSFRSQHAAKAHFGLGSADQVELVEIRWPNGRQQRLERPRLNRYHSVAPALTGALP